MSQPASLAALAHGSQTFDFERHRPGRVLLVDDDPAVLRSYRRLLTRAGFHVLTAGSAEEALELTADKDFDVVVSDRMMPGMTGLELLRKVRERCGDLPFVLMSGLPDFSSAAAAVELGALRYLPKPTCADDLKRAVNDAVAARHVSRRREQAMSLFDVWAREAEVNRELDGQLTQALDMAEMAFQPIVDAEGEHIFGFEALLRSHHKKLNNPFLVITAAEKLDRVHELGRVVRARVSEALSYLPAEAVVFVNLHPRELEDENLYDPEAPLSSHARRVVLELTERAALDDDATVRESIARLRQLGYRVAVDDLGAGYASLSALALLQPDVVKIDMSLVRGVDQDPVRLKLVRAIAAVARELSMTVVAEGIETEEERAAVVAAGCQLLQGYLLGRPAFVESYADAA